MYASISFLPNVLATINVNEDIIGARITHGGYFSVALGVIY